MHNQVGLKKIFWNRHHPEISPLKQHWNSVLSYVWECGFTGQLNLFKCPLFILQNWFEMCISVYNVGRRSVHKYEAIALRAKIQANVNGTFEDGEIHSFWVEVTPSKTGTGSSTLTLYCLKKASSLYNFYNLLQIF